MADFARYSTGPSAEWLRFEKTWKRPEAIPTMTIREARDQANNKTAKLFANTLGRPGKSKSFIGYYLASFF